MGDLQVMELTDVVISSRRPSEDSNSDGQQSQQHQSGSMHLHPGYRQPRSRSPSIRREHRSPSPIRRLYHHPHHYHHSHHPHEIGFSDTVSNVVEIVKQENRRHRTGSWSASTSPVRSPSPDRSENGRTYYGTTSLDQRSRSPSPVSTGGNSRRQQQHRLGQPHHLQHRQQLLHHGGTAVDGGGTSTLSSATTGPAIPPRQPLPSQQTAAASAAQSASATASHQPHQYQHQLHATSVSAMMTGVAAASAAAANLTMPPPSMLVNSSYPVLAVIGCNRRRLPPTPNKPSSLQLRPPHSASINFPKLNSSPTRGSPAALPKPPVPASATAAAVARQSMAMTAMPPLSFEQAMSIGRSGRLLPSPVRNGYAASSSKQQLQPSSVAAARRQKINGSGGGGVGGTGVGGGGGRVSSRHSDSDEDDWC
ncbi:Hypothetical protein CINCED_3A001475 [Cinara cedri]|uniref:Uncharacterized protein n=1 Tax=Cinara cedri TaxID=506608 RepID=A0A5E4MG32_9HEMI|nr:Hypothetical protein CINCED_3A001475 [Cinara cedri]